MKEFPVSGSNSLKFEQRERGFFSITDMEEGVINLPREIGRKVWFALSAMSKMSNNMRIDGRTGWMHFMVQKHQKKLAKLEDFLRRTNCHGTSRLLTSTTWENPYRGWSFTSSFIRRDSQTIGSLKEVFDRQGAPLLVYSEAKNHSLVILGYNKKDGRFITFEKIGFNFPFKLSVTSEEDLKHFNQYLPLNSK